MLIARCRDRHRYRDRVNEGGGCETVMITGTN